jgi:hypothetical protein
VVLPEGDVDLSLFEKTPDVAGGVFHGCTMLGCMGFMGFFFCKILLEKRCRVTG